ncbi:Na+/H+ antiporter NhaA [Streptomyces sp. HUAS 31]|uniref:Na+/H+ antiporter NhaA n=1 Tax=Streptomyces sp. HUAS 31 TaxID=3020055 RepID=UPI003FA6ACC3
MTVFFLVVGLEACRDFGMGELHGHKRLALSLTARVNGMLVPIGICLASNVGHSSAQPWAAAMATDPAFGISAPPPTATWSAPAVSLAPLPRAAHPRGRAHSATGLASGLSPNELIRRLFRPRERVT